LLDEREYYAAKVAFLNLAGDQEQRALEAQIARMQQEKLTGKDKVDNDRKIVETRAKLLKVQQDVTAQQIVLETQETAAVRQRAAALLSARQAATDYYDEVSKQQERALALVGASDRQRDLGAGINQIEDRYAGQRRDLEN